MFKPMLAADVELNKLYFPVIASPKLDGVRALVIDGVVYSRSGKPIPNRHVQQMFKHLSYYDGELIVGSPVATDCYRKTVSGVMTEGGTPDVYFYVFDHFQFKSDTFLKRLTRLKASDHVVIVLQQGINTMPELEEFETCCLEKGFEGLILRSPDSPYKEGRSTMAQGWMLKLKRFHDAEFVVVGFEEQRHNNNTATLDEFGYTKRSSHKAGMAPAGVLGALILRWNGGNDTFNCGTGFDAADRVQIWNNKDMYLGKVAKVKYFQIGMKDKPRHPVFLGWRDPLDV